MQWFRVSAEGLATASRQWLTLIRIDKIYEGERWLAFDMTADR
jgi:hypothetical protein